MPRNAPCDQVVFDLEAGGRQLRAKAILPQGQELAGSPAALVFLHEGLGSISQWRDFPLALVQATGLPALIYDRYGHGKSEPLHEPRSPYYLEKEAQTGLPEVLAACGVEAPILVGHSDGASIALLFGSFFPKIPLGIISEAAHVFVENLAIQGIWKTLRAFESTPLRTQLARHHGTAVDSMFHGWSDVWLSPEYQTWNMLDRLGAISAPVLAIQGEDDEYGTVCQVRAILDRVAGPAEGLLIPACAHVPHFQARERVLANMTRFIQGTIHPGKKA